MANELANTNPSGGLMQGLERNPMARQLLLLVGIAAAVAIGVVTVLWSRTPSYAQLYAGLPDKDLAMVTEGLQKSNIAYKVEAGGLLMVPAGQLADARLKLAAQGLPKGTEGGYEMLQQEQGFGTSQFIETARYQHALESELARSISALSNVQTARVHLAIPKQSAFIRNRQAPTASVLVNLYPGRNLEDGEVAAIVHLVAASVPNLDARHVTVVDQRGRLLNSIESSRDFALNASQFEYTRKMEDSYARRIEEIVTPIVGYGGVHAQVVADLDFTVTEETQEKFNPKEPALRSEQTAQEQSIGNAAAAGIPGALSNQPPGAATVPETTAASKPAAKGAAPAPTPAPPVVQPSNSSNRATRNFELDKVISHTRPASGGVKRLSIAVVLDDKQSTNDDGEIVRTPLKPEVVAQITELVKEAVGFDEKRGDRINVINASFTQPIPLEPLPETPLWKEAWVWEAVKQVLAGVLVLFLVFRVLLPVMRGLLARNAAPATVHMTLPAGATEAQMQALGNAGAPAQLGGPTPYEAQLNTARSMTAQDPKRVAQVVKNWVASDG
jgi:flagellar M-ring protein FliF